MKRPFALLFASLLVGGLALASLLPVFISIEVEADVVQAVTFPGGEDTLQESLQVQAGESTQLITEINNRASVDAKVKLVSSNVTGITITHEFANQTVTAPFNVSPGKHLVTITYDFNVNMNNGTYHISTELVPVLQ